MSQVLHVVYRGRADYIRASESVLEAIRDQIRDIRADVRIQLAERAQRSMAQDIFRMLFDRPSSP